MISRQSKREKKKRGKRAWLLLILFSLAAFLVGYFYSAGNFHL